MATKLTNTGGRAVSGSEAEARKFLEKSEGKVGNEVKVKLTKTNTVGEDHVVDVGERPAAKMMQKGKSLLGKVVGLDIPEVHLDGRQLGGDKKLYPSTVSMRETVPPVVASTRRNKETGLAVDELPDHERVEVMEINGIMTKATDQFATLEGLADTLSPTEAGQAGPHAEIRGIHNGTDGFARDLSQCIKDKFEFGHNAAVATLRNKILDRITTGLPVNIISHSQGGLCTSRAITEVRLALQEGLGITRREALELMSKTMNVLTCGAAAWQYPSGPNYIHLVNKDDPVPMVMGAGVEYKKESVLSKLGVLMGRFFYLLDKANPLMPNRHDRPFYFGGADDTPNTVFLESLEENHGLRKIMDNHSIDGPYKAWMDKSRERLMNTFFKTSDKTLSDEELTQLGVNREL